MTLTKVTPLPALMTASFFAMVGSWLKVWTGRALRGLRYIDALQRFSGTGAQIS
jgi:hypothetical protein